MECQKWRNITRKFGVASAGLCVGLVFSGARAGHMPDTILEEHALEFGFCFNSGTHLTIILDLIRLTLVINHE